MQRSVLDYLECSACRYPEKTVFADSSEEISYQTLIRKAKGIASGIRRRIGSQARNPIMVLIDRDVKSVISFFGIVYSGNFYVPIDKELPLERIESMIKSMHPIGMIYQKSHEAIAVAIRESVKKMSYEELLREEIDEMALNEVRGQMLDTDPLYAIFTSGSTGVPKGVVVGNHSVIDLVDVFQETFGFDETCIFGNQAPFDFDVSVKDIYSTIKNGATMYIVPHKLFVMPAKLITFLNEKKINTIIWAVSALVIVANFKGFKSETPQYLRNIMFSGEVMPNKVLNYWRAALPNAQYVNLYGPTEITCNCTYYKVERHYEDEEPLPIGKSFLNTGILLLDSEHKQLVENGEIGEICVSGSSLALGYYNELEKTDGVFIQNPLNPHYPERIYCTGDMGKYDSEGNLLFMSRKDAQIKHMGHRIELGEIEIAVNALPFIEVAVCIYDEPAQKIVLFYQSEQDYKKEIIAELGKRLPKYMQPNQYYQYDKLPLNKHAKIDRLKLKEILGVR